MLKSLDQQAAEYDSDVQDARRPVLAVAAKVLVQLTLMVAIIAGSVMAMNWLVATKPERPKRPPFQTVYPVETVSVVIGNHVPTVTVYGNVVSERSVELRALVAGEIIWVSDALQAGSQVNKGDVLARIDPFAYEGALREAAANETQAIAQIAEIEARLSAEKDQLTSSRNQLELAKKDLDRAARLQSSGSLTSKQLEERELAVSIRQQAVHQRESNIKIETARLNQQKAALERLRWKVEQAKKNLSDTVVLAPFSGVIRSSTAEVGRMTGTNDIVVAMYSLEELAARFTLTDAQFGRMVTDSSPLVGRPLQAFWSVGETDYRITGRVTRIGADIVTARGGVEIMAALDRENLPAQIRPGAFLEIRLSDRTYTNAVRVPEDAVYGSDTVYLVKDGALVARAVRILAYEDGAAILSGNLANGDLIMTTRLSVASEGLKVKPADAQTGGGNVESG